VTVQTKSPLVLRDLAILKRAADAEVGFTITTTDERIRRTFEPGAPPIAKRAPLGADLKASAARPVHGDWKSRTITTTGWP
jgi:DNA repair photolyase